MSPIYLDSLDEFMLARIVKKFNSFHTGANFYRRCRGARDLVDRIKPVWPLPRHHLLYMHDQKGVCVSRDNGVRKELLYLTGFEGTWGEMPVLGKSLPPIEWCRIEDLYLFGVSVTVVLPQIQAMGAVKSLHARVRMYDEEEMQRLMTAAKPETVIMSLWNVLATSTTLKDVKNLHILADDWSNKFRNSKTCKELEDFWESKKIFELMTSRKAITWTFHFLYKGCIMPFLQNWLKGELTGSCEKLTIEVRQKEV